MKNTDSTIIKINNKIIRTDMQLNDEEIELLKKVLFGNKPSLCQTCTAKVCLAKKEELTGPIFEGFSAKNTNLVTKCANKRN